MNNWDYVREVSALRAPEHLRGKIAGLPAQNCGGRRPRRAIPAKWHSIAAALVLVAGLGVAAPAILRAFTTGGEITPPPPVAATPTAPAGIVAGGIDVSPVILNAAKEYVGQQLIVHAALPGAAVLVDGEFQEGPSAIYDNWRIEGLESCYERKELGDYTVSVYRLDYRLHTTTPERVPLAGAAEVDEEGWALVTYPHSTYLVFLLNYSTSHYFATMIDDCGPGDELFDENIKAGIDSYVAGLDEDTADTDPWGITLRVENATPTGLTLICEQSGGAPTGNLQTGRAYTLERYADGTWAAVETLPGVQRAWTLEGLGIPTNDARQWDVDWNWLYGTLPPGEYRIGKEIMDSRAAGDYDKKVYYADFSIITPDLFPTLDFYAYKDVMSDEEWEAMEGFLPVLLEGAIFSRTDGTTFEAQGDITLDEFLPEFWGEALESNQLHLWRLAVADADGDGKRELVLALKDAAYCYLVLHREGDKFYSIDFPVRWFGGLQTNGVFVGSGGASYQTYYKMAFENGSFKKEYLGDEAWSSDTDGTFDIGGQAVDADAFIAWRDELMVGDVTWYDHISKTWT